MGRRVSHAGVFLLGILANGCIENALSYYLSHDGGAGSDAGLLDSGMADGGAADGGAVDGGPNCAMLPCSSAQGCIGSWQLFLECGTCMYPRPLCLPDASGFTGQASLVALHGPAAGYSSSTVAFAQGSHVWAGVVGAADGLTLVDDSDFFAPVTSLGVANGHDAPMTSTPCVDAMMTLDNGANDGGYLSTCGGPSAGYLTLTYPGAIQGLSWADGVLSAAHGSFGQDWWIEVGHTSQLGLPDPAYQVEGVSNPLPMCASWLSLQDDTTLETISVCGGPTSNVSAPVSVPGGSRMAVNPDGSVVVVGWDAGSLFAFGVGGSPLSAGDAGWLDGAVGPITAVQVATWSADATTRVVFLDAAGTPYFVDLDVNASPPAWGAPTPVANVTSVDLAAPLDPHILLLWDAGSQQVSIQYLP